MRYHLIALAVGIALCCAGVSFAQENVTITTYFPAPYGDYNDLNVHNDFIVHDQNGTSANTTISSDNNGNLIIGSNQNFPQVIFEDTGEPFSYLKTFSSNGGVTYCANGYMAAGFLDSSKDPANPGELPSSGYIICLRGWE